jgi:glyoxylase-like metal-dependent hydrolase (beta-lactamase superfamily II)
MRLRIQTIGLLLVGLVVSAAWLVILRLKGVPVLVLVLYGLLLLGLLGWRRRVLALAVGASTLALYFAVVFHRGDIPVLLGLTAAAFLVGASVVRTRRRDVPSRRAFLLGGVGVVLGVLTGVSAVWTSRRQRDWLVRVEQERAAAIRAPGRRRRVVDGAVRVFPLHTGDTVVTFGQFYGGLDGWEGLHGYLRTLLDKTQIVVPIYTYLIDHPRHGLLMVDAGINWEQAHDHDGYYSGASRLLTERDEYRLAIEQDLPVRVARLGYDIGDVSTVFLTHVHDDHAGGLRYLPGAEVVLDRRDWDDGVRYPYSFGLVEDSLSFPRFDSGAFGAFPRSQDHFGDGSVILLPTPGHSPGHMCVLLRMDVGNVLFVGDTLYTVPHLAVDQVRQMTIGGVDTVHQVEAARRIQSLLAAEPDTVPLFAHDNTRYQHDLVASVFAGGRPGAAGFRRLRQHLATVLTPDWRLRLGHTPSFVAADEGPGRVEFR